MDSNYMSLPERISKQFSEVDSDITVDLRKSNPSYNDLSRQMEEMKSRIPLSCSFWREKARSILPMKSMKCSKPFSACI